MAMRGRRPPGARGTVVTVPGHRIGAPLGFGANGAVWAARDDAGRDVAVSVLPLGAGEAGTTAMRRLAALRGSSHPHLARVVDVVGLEQGRCALVSELVPGPTLATVHAARGPFSDGELATLLSTLGSALGHLHERGVIHGDVSPANVVLAPGGVPVLVDLAGEVAHELGTPGFVAPERARGQVAGAAGDVWALARLLVWAGGSETAGRLGSLLGAALDADPRRRPHARDLASLAPVLAAREPVRVPPPPDLAQARLRSTEAPTRVRPASRRAVAAAHSSRGAGRRARGAWQRSATSAGQSTRAVEQSAPGARGVGGADGGPVGGGGWSAGRVRGVGGANGWSGGGGGWPAGRARGVGGADGGPGRVGGQAVGRGRGFGGAGGGSGRAGGRSARDGRRASGAGRQSAGAGRHGRAVDRRDRGENGTRGAAVAALLAGVALLVAGIQVERGISGNADAGGAKGAEMPLARARPGDGRDADGAAAGGATPGGAEADRSAPRGTRSSGDVDLNATALTDTDVAGAVLGALLERRDRALVAGDGPALSTVNAAGGPSAMADEALLETMTATGTLLRGLETDVVEVRSVVESDGGAVVEAVLLQRGHERVVGGERVAVPAQPERCVRLELTGPDPWLLVAAGPCE